MAMRPSTPSFNFAQQAGPSSPPATPTTSTFATSKSRRHGIPSFAHLVSSSNGVITPNGNGPTFSYNPFQLLDPDQLSPRSSSPSVSPSPSPSPSPESSSDEDEDEEEDEDEDDNEPSSPPPSSTRTTSPAPKQHNIRIVAVANFEIEDFNDSDYNAFDSNTSSPIRPTQYEDAVSEASSRPNPSSLLPQMQDLHCQESDSSSSDEESEQDEEELERQREKWLLKVKEERRRKRRSSGSVQKRSHAQSIGSDTDDEDIQEMFDGPGSSARRLRRRTGDNQRASLIFDDPPARIDECEEPDEESHIRIIRGEITVGGVIGGIGETEEGQWAGVVDREMPYFIQMDVDSDDD